MARAKKKTTTRKKTTATRGRKVTAKKTVRKAAVKRKTTRKTTAKRKTTTRKTTARKTTVRKTTASKVTATATVAKRKPVVLGKLPTTAVKSTHNKSNTFAHIAELTDLHKKDVANVFEVLSNLIQRHITKRKGPGEFTVPGLLKIRVVRKPATKARKGINPFTGEEIMFKAKPARNVVKIRALKKLKEMAE